MPASDTRFSLDILTPQQLFERVAMRRKKQLVFVASRRLLRLDDVKQARGGHGNALDEERAPLVPDGLEIESLHHQRQVDQQFVRAGRARERPALDHTRGEPPIPWSIEWFAARPELEASAFTGGPGLRQVVRIERQE